MSKIIKHIVCVNGDCSKKKIKNLPLMTFIGINVVIETAFTVFCFHNIKKYEKNFENLEILQDRSHNFAPLHNNNTYGV